MPNLSNQDVQLGPGMFTSSATQAVPLGTRGWSADGRAWHYALAGAVDLIPGTVVQSAVPIAGAQGATVNTTSETAIGGSSLTLTMASTIAANFFREGYAVIASSASQGYLYQLDSHAAVSTGATGVFKFYAPQDANTLVTAIATTSTVTLMANRYSGVIVVPATTATSRVVGVATYVITAAQYGWIQTWGPCAVKTNDASVIGQTMVGVAASCGCAAGVSSPAVTGCYIVGQIIGNIMQTGVAGQWCLIDLSIAA